MYVLWYLQYKIYVYTLHDVSTEKKIIVTIIRKQHVEK